MALSHSELLALVDEVNVAVSQIIANYAELREGMIDAGATDAAAAKVDRLRQDTLVAKENLADLKGRQQHKKELDRIRRDHERRAHKAKQNEDKSSSGMIPLRNQHGVLIGWIQSLGGDRVNVLDARGRIVARELNGITLDRSGRFAGRGKLGLVVLGQSLAR